MRLGRLELDSRFLGTRVGRRMLAVVSVCALAPVIGFALIAHHWVGSVLESQSIASLEREAKARGMAVLERLMLAEEALRQPSSPTASAGARRALKRALSAEQWERLEAGRAVLGVSESAGAPPELLLGVLHDGRLRTRAFHPEELFGGLLESAAQYRVLDAGGEVLVESEGAGEAPVLLGEWPLFLEPSLGAGSWTLRIGKTADRVYAPLRAFERFFLWFVAAALLVAFGLSSWQIRRTLEPIVELTEGAQRIASGDYSVRVDVSSRDEFGQLSETFNAMSRDIDEHVRVLSTVNRVGGALSAERKTGRLLQLILEGTLEATRADAGVIFLLGPEGALHRADSRWTGVEAGAEELDRRLPTDLLEQALHQRGFPHARVLASLDADERAAWRRLEASLPDPLQTYMTVPLCDEEQRHLGLLVLLRWGSHGFDRRQAASAASLASQAAVAIRKNDLVDSFRGLFEGLIGLTVSAIDQKSAYTGDHCRKVPILTEMIADAVCQDASGAYKRFELDASERYELRIAALLHDCGKVVTPVHVMDKATKLETIVDRIALVEARFELLRRDLIVERLRRELPSASRERIDGDPELRSRLAAVDDDFAFLRSCNLGSERMSDADLERLQRIARQCRWTSADGSVREAVEPDELMNLSIRRGTLNPEERRVIEHHVSATMSMLDELPFPPEMSRVPAIAGAHHERIDGGGYPLGLRGEELGVQARILGLADVFEALTAPDRPYKPGRTLRETLDILEAMSEEGHIDPDLLDLFLRDELHLRYAVEHMRPGQIDSEFQEAIERLTGP